MQLFSAALPVGGFSYSQGLEYAVERAWLTDTNDVEAWLSSQLEGSIVHQELPLLLRCYQCCCSRNWDGLGYWSAFAVACRDTLEMRMEERTRGKAMLKWWTALRANAEQLDSVSSDWVAGVETNNRKDSVNTDACRVSDHRRQNHSTDAFIPTLSTRSAAMLAESPLVVFALAAAEFGIDQRHLMAGFVHHWLESQVITAVKLVPIGQSQGQQLLYRLASDIPRCCDVAELIDDEAIGCTMPAQSFASVAHESQYSRSYRS